MEPRRLMKELIFNRHRVFVSVTRIDVVENLPVRPKRPSNDQEKDHHHHCNHHQHHD